MAYIDRFNPPNMHHIGGINYVMMTDCANMVKEIERLREALKGLLDATDQWVFQDNYPLAVKKAKAALKEGE